MKVRGIFVIILALAIALVGCNIEDKDNDGLPIPNGENGQNNNDEIEYEPAYGGTLTVPISYVKTLNPLLNKDLNLYHFNKLIFEGLFDFDDSLKIQPILAEGYEINEDGRRIRIKLRENILWHDGEAFTAEDVEFTINTIKHGASIISYRELLTSIYKPSKPGDIQHILNVKIIDENTVEIFFDRSYSNALESLIFPIIPKHQFVQGEVVNVEAYERALAIEGYVPIGTGPYEFDNYEEIKALNLKVNTNWWNGKPYIENITGKVLADNELATTAFQARQTDLALALGVDWEKYTQSAEKEIYSFTSQNYVFLGFNLNNELFAGDDGNAIRKAIAYGLNRKKMIQKLYLDHATSIDVPIPPNSWLISNDANIYKYNTEEARRILREAGFIDSNDDGILEDENGNKLTIRLLTNSYNELRRNTANMITEDLNKIGIEVVKDYDDREEDGITEEMVGNQWEKVIEKTANGEFEMVLLEYQLSYIPDLAFLFHSTAIETGTNITSYQNEEMDSLITEAFSVNSLDRKKEVYEEIQTLIVNDLPFVSLYFRDSALLVQDRIKGDIDPQSFNIYYNISQWFIPEELQK